MKVDINNIYVGELYISYQIGYLQEGIKGIDERETYEEKYNLINNGAISLDEYQIRNYIDSNRRFYMGFLTIFADIDQTINDKKALTCYHNDTDYSFEGKQFCKNLIPLTQLLPKLDYNIPEELNSNQVKKLFNLLFKNNYNLFKLLNNTPHYIDDFFVGTLDLYTGNYPNDDTCKMFQFANLPQKFILKKNGAKYIGPTNDFNGYAQSQYKTIFIRTNKGNLLLPENGLLNIQNNQIYKGLLQKATLKRTNPQDTYFDNITSLKAFLKENGIKLNDDELSIKKALKLFKKANLDK